MPLINSDRLIMPKLTLRLISVALLPAVVFILLGLSANRFRLVEVEVGSSSSTDLASLRGYRFALVSDPHLSDTPNAWRSWGDVIQRINASEADYVFLLGDYTQEVLDDRQLEGFRARFIESLTAFTTSPILVLGNHESWNDRQVWYAELERSGFDVLENEAISTSGDRPLCVIGVGDAHTGFAEKKSYTDTCMNTPSLTITHDPAAAFDLQGRGLWLAGHTHCGQITLPFTDPLWAPTTAPSQAQCGYYEDDSKRLFVSSGVGSSVLPIRFFAHSQVEILTIR